MKTKENNTFSAIFGNKVSGTVVERFVGYVLSPCSMNKHIMTNEVFNPVKTMVFILAFSMLGSGVLVLMEMV